MSGGGWGGPLPAEAQAPIRTARGYRAPQFNYLGLTPPAAAPDVPAAPAPPPPAAPSSIDTITPAGGGAATPARAAWDGGNGGDVGAGLEPGGTYGPGPGGATLADTVSLITDRLAPGLSNSTAGRSIAGAVAALLGAVGVPSPMVTNAGIVADISRNAAAGRFDPSLFGSGVPSQREAGARAQAAAAAALAAGEQPAQNPTTFDADTLPGYGGMGRPSQQTGYSTTTPGRNASSPPVAGAPQAPGISLAAQAPGVAQAAPGAAPAPATGPNSAPVGSTTPAAAGAPGAAAATPAFGPSPDLGSIPGGTVTGPGSLVGNTPADPSNPFGGTGVGSPTVDRDLPGGVPPGGFSDLTGAGSGSPTVGGAPAPGTPGDLGDVTGPGTGSPSVGAAPAGPVDPQTAEAFGVAPGGTAQATSDAFGTAPGGTAQATSDAFGAAPAGTAEATQDAFGSGTPGGAQDVADPDNGDGNDGAPGADPGAGPGDGDGGGGGDGDGGDAGGSDSGNDGGIYATGGTIEGGTPGIDSVDITAQQDEYVWSVPMVDALGFVLTGQHGPDAIAAAHQFLDEVQEAATGEAPNNSENDVGEGGEQGEPTAGGDSEPDPNDPGDAAENEGDSAMAGGMPPGGAPPAMPPGGGAPPTMPGAAPPGAGGPGVEQLLQLLTAILGQHGAGGAPGGAPMGGPGSQSPYPIPPGTPPSGTPMQSVTPGMARGGRVMHPMPMAARPATVAPPQRAAPPFRRDVPPPTQSAAKQGRPFAKGGAPKKGIGFNAAAASVERRQNLPPDRARAIIAAGARKASPAAKKANPNLRKVPGA